MKRFEFKSRNASGHAFVWIMSAIFIVLTGVLYYPTLQWLITKDWMREDYNYAVFIPALVAYLIWEKRDILSVQNKYSSGFGLVVFVVAMLCFWLGELAGEFFVQYLSLWLLCVGFVWLLFGYRIIKTLAFPIMISLAMFPFPIFINNQLTLKLKLISSQLGVELLKLSGRSVYREGNIIDLGFTQLQVVDACSGLRYLIPLVLLGILSAYYFRGRMWKKIVLVLSTIPLAIVTNALRIAMTGILFKYIGARAAEGFFHDFSGWLIFLLTFALLYLEMKILARIPDGYMPEENPDGQGAPARQQIDENLASAKKSPPRNKYLALVAIVLMLGSVFTVQFVNFRENIPLSKELAAFPMTIGPWQGQSGSMEQVYIDSLDLSDYLIADYRDNKNHAINFYVAYYETQSKGKSIHTPDTCLPGGGWVFEETGTTTIKLNDPEKTSLKVKRSIMSKNGRKQLAYYWFMQRGRILNNVFELKWYAMVDALLRHRTDGALIRVITPIGEYEDIGSAQRRMQDFLTQSIPIVETYIPQ